MSDFPFWACVAFILGWRALAILAADLAGRRRSTSDEAAAKLMLEALDKRLQTLEAEATKARLREGLTRRG